MGKSETIHMRIEPDVKFGADGILSRLGITTAEAINMFLNQVILRGGLPFEVRLPEPNDLTLKTIQDAENGIGVHSFETAEEMFKELGV